MKKKLLLHLCCAPCSASCVEFLHEDFDISFYWYNPNIYDEQEYEKRRESVVKYAQELGFSFYEEELLYDYEKWRAKSSEICENCYRIRLEKAALFAKNNNFDFFSTSLLSSPYQKHDLIKEISEGISKIHGVGFLYRDFRPKFYEGKNSLRKKGYYIQKYCACRKSYNERFPADKK